MFYHGHQHAGVVLTLVKTEIKQETVLLVSQPPCGLRSFASIQWKLTTYGRCKSFIPVLKIRLSNASHIPQGEASNRNISHLMSVVITTPTP